MPQTEARSLPLWMPLKISVAWLLGTFLLFLLVGEVDKVPSLAKLTTFIAATIIAFAVGYRASVKRYEKLDLPPFPAETRKSIGQIKLVTAASGIYFASYGLVLLSVYGVDSPTAILGAIVDPGKAYFAKFHVYDTQQALGTVSLPVQVLTLVAVFSTPLVPFLVVYYRHLTADIRILATVGLTLYALYFLSIGTLIGLGNVLIFAAVASMVAWARTNPTSRKRRRTMRVTVGLGALVFAGYMAYNQSARISTIGISDRYEPNPIVKNLTGDEFARGITLVALYPTQGYEGLSYNLETSFEWTKGRGSSRALDSYLDQYGIGSSVYDDTYPRRTEIRTGWPAGQVWSTIYPWLASDLSFPGAIAFMAVVGWWLARFWYEAIALGSRLALLLLCQLGILITFVPANNQIGIGRPSLIAFLSLIVLYAVSRVNAGLRLRRSGAAP